MSTLPREVFESLDWASAAHHEGGHATACLALGHTVEYAVLRFHPNGGGDDWTVDGEVQLPDKPHYDPHDMAIVALAGPVGEALYRHSLGESWRLALRITREGNPSDEKALKNYLREAKLKEKQALRTCEDLVKRYWRGTQRIATELMRKQELSGRRIRQLVG